VDDKVFERGGNKLSVLEESFVVGVRKHAIKDCEEQYSDQQMEVINKNEKFQKEKAKIFETPLSTKYKKQHEFRNAMRYTFIISMFVVFIVAAIIMAVYSTWGADHSLIISVVLFFSAIGYSLAFMFFSSALEYSSYEKNNYDYYYNEYLMLLEKYSIKKKGVNY